MFLKKLYRHNKWLFLLMILFITGQLFINFKRGMVVSPFYHYGMYSEVMKPNLVYGVYEVEVDKVLLQANNFSAQQWDKIILPIKYFHALDSMNLLYQTDVKRLMSALNLKTDDRKFILPCNAKLFYKQYKNYLIHILDAKIDTLDISYRMYSFTGNRLKPTTQVSSLAQLCK